MHLFKYVCVSMHVYVCTHVNLCLCNDKYIDFLHLLAGVNKAAMSIDALVHAHIHTT